jgi:hypothetical protein
VSAGALVLDPGEKKVAMELMAKEGYCWGEEMKGMMIIEVLKTVKEFSKDVLAEEGNCWLKET